MKQSHQYYYVFSCSKKPHQPKPGLCALPPYKRFKTFEEAEAFILKREVDRNAAKNKPYV